MPVKYRLNISQMKRLIYPLQCQATTDGKTCLEYRAFALENPERFDGRHLKRLIDGDAACVVCLGKMVLDHVLYPSPL